MITEIDYSKISVPDIVNQILLYGSSNDAEYILLDSTKEGIDVRLLINDDFINYTKIPNDIKDRIIRRIKIISGMDILRVNVKQRGDLKIEIQGLPVDFDVSIVPGNTGEDILIKVVSFKKQNKE